MAAREQLSSHEEDYNTLAAPPEAPIAAPPSPLAPPYSPITPKLSNSEIPAPVPPNPSEQLIGFSNSIVGPHQAQQIDQTLMPPPPPVAPCPVHGPNVQAPTQPQREPSPQEPPPQPLDLASNTDAIALKAAMSVLTLQRQQAIRDIQALEKQKQAALEDPQAYADAVRNGQVKMKDDTGGGIQFSYSGDEASDSSEEDTQQDAEDDMAMDTSFNGEDPLATTTTAAPDRKLKAPRQSYPPLPRAQNVVRTPPVNWSKYHIVGPALDRLHESQRQNPDQGRPRTDHDVQVARERHEQLKLAKQKEGLKKLAQQGKIPGRRSGAGNLVAAPYDAFRDEVVSKEEVDAVLKTPQAREGQIQQPGSAQKKGKAEVAGNKKARKSGSATVTVTATGTPDAGASTPATGNNKKKGTTTGASNNKKKKGGGRGRPLGSGVNQKAANAATSTSALPALSSPATGTEPGYVGGTGQGGTTTAPAATGGPSHISAHGRS